MAEKFPPGSFTKNYGWDTSPPGLRKLHENIRSGFSGHSLPVSRDNFRARHGPGPELVAVNFFLHNTIIGRKNYVTADELVRQALTTDHSHAFDQLALFSFHLGRVGERTGRNGLAEGAAFANDYVRHSLWNGSGWDGSMATIEAIKDRFNQSVIVTGKGDATKTSTNYRFILAAGLRNQITSLLNTRWADWIGSAAFLFFDRVSLDEYAGGVPSSDQLISAAKEAELHKLVGGSEAEVMNAVSSLANSYRSVGGFGRNWAGVSKGHTAGIPQGIEVFDTPVGHPKWSDEAASEMAYIERRRREIQAQVRNPMNVNELKSLYENKCFFCGHSVQIGVDPNRHYSEAAHIRPVGSPHSGSDRKDNMILLCPEHHLQFDRGILRIRWHTKNLTLESRIPGDPLHETTLRVLPPHELARDNVEWHYAYWS